MNYVKVDLAGTSSKTYMDLSTKRMYGDQWAVQRDTVYSYDDTYKNKLLGFDYLKK